MSYFYYNKLKGKEHFKHFYWVLQVYRGIVGKGSNDPKDFLIK